MKNSNAFGFLVLLALLMSSACNPDDNDLVPTVDVEVNIKGAFGDDLLLMRKDYPLTSTSNIRFDRVSFYVSDLVLLKNVEGGSDEETGVLDIELVDFTPFTEMAPGTAANGLSFIGTNIPVDNYKGIKMGLGVPADQNRLNPSDQSLGPDHPLTNTVHYWQGWQSYMFAMVEGVVDWNGNGIYEAEESFKYHTGKDEAYQNAFVLKDLTMEAGTNPVYGITIDVKKIFMNDDGTFLFDAQTNQNTHNPDDFPFIQQFMVYFSKVFSF